MSFTYNPLRGGTIYLYPQDRELTNPRIGILTAQPVTETENGAKTLHASAFNGLVQVTIDEARNIEVFVRGKKTERFTIKYHGRKQKRVFSSH